MDSESQEKILPEGEKKWQYLAALSGGLGGFCMGSVIGYSSPALPKLVEDPHLHLSDFEASLVGSLVNVGLMCSGVATAFFLARFGRKTTMMLITIPFIIGWLLIISAVHVSMLYIGRIITGFCAGAFSVASPMYIAETAEVRVRGRFCNYFEVLDCSGLLFSYLVGWAVGWQWFAAICCAVPLVFCTIFYFMPETPSYLVTIGDIKEAKRALQKLRGPHYDVEPELLILLKRAQQSQEHKGSFKDLTTGVNLRIFIVCLGVVAFQQLSGINTVTFFSTDIFRAAGLSLDPNLCGVIIAIIFVVSTFCSTLFIDRLGRKPLLLISGSVMGLSLIFLGLSFYLGSNKTGSMALYSLMVYGVAAAIGYGPITFTLTGEIFPLGVRELGSSICMSFVWFVSFMTTVTFKPLIGVIDMEGVYWMYSGLNFVGVAFVCFFVKETKGKTQEQILNDYRK